MLKVYLLIAGLISVQANQEAIDEFVQGNHIFTANVYKELLKTNEGNFLVSPLSAETVLALTAEGAKGDTLEQLRTGLKFPTLEKTRAAVGSLLPQLDQSTEDLKLLSANKIYLQDGFNVVDNFKKTAVGSYKSDIENLDFSKKDEAAGRINNWVANKTNDKIHDLIRAEALGPGVRAVLVNALYFSGKWVTPFEDYRTHKEKFYKTETETVDVDMMHVTDSFNYYEDADLDAKFLELPYIGGDISMTIVLPNKKEGLKSLEGKIENVFKRPNYKSERVNVAMPKFTIETTIQFVPILKNLGVKDIFDSSKADLSGISGGKDLFVSDVIQKAFINVTESGTEAAAATAVIMRRKSKLILLGPTKPKDFIADHPFVYAIRFKDILLFAGRLNK